MTAPTDSLSAETSRPIPATFRQALFVAGSIFLLGYTIGTIGFGLAPDRWGRKAFSLGYVLAAGVALVLVPRFGWQSASSTEAIRYALVFFLLQALFVFVGTALADWVGRRPSAILGALIEIASTVLAVTADSRSQYVVFGRSPSPPSAGSGASVTPMSPNSSRRCCAAPAQRP